MQSNVLDNICQKFGLTNEQVHPLEGFENIIYEFNRDGQSFILRIAHSSRRTMSQIQAEIDWINYLHDQGVGVSRAVESKHQSLVEQIDDGEGGHHLATIFYKAPGQLPGKTAWPPEFFKAYGQTLGKMHRLTQAYKPSRPQWKRHCWDDAQMRQCYLPFMSDKILSIYHELEKHFKQLPKDKKSYGLIHRDAHRGNFFIDDQMQITLFDFDDSAYSWFVEDIAIILYYMVRWNADNACFTKAVDFLKHFFEGYHKEHELPPHWLKQIPYFLKNREIELYAVIRWRVGEDYSDDAAAGRFMDGRKELIESGQQHFDLDFTQSLS